MVQRLRGVLVAAVIWGLLWLPLVIVAGVLTYIDVPPYDLILDTRAAPKYPPAFPIVARTTIAYVVWGAIVGLIFAFVLVAAARKRTFEDISSRRMAVWGALAAIALPFLLYVVQVIEWGQVEIGWRLAFTLILTPAFGAACAAGMLRLARRAGSLTSA